MGLPIVGGSGLYGLVLENGLFLENKLQYGLMVFCF